MIIPDPLPKQLRRGQGFFISEFVYILVSLNGGLATQVLDSSFFRPFCLC